MDPTKKNRGEFRWSGRVNSFYYLKDNRYIVHFPIWYLSFRGKVKEFVGLEPPETTELIAQAFFWNKHYFGTNIQLIFLSNVNIQFDFNSSTVTVFVFFDFFL